MSSVRSKRKSATTSTSSAAASAPPPPAPTGSSQRVAPPAVNTHVGVSSRQGRGSPTTGVQMTARPKGSPTSKGKSPRGAPAAPSLRDLAKAKLLNDILTTETGGEGDWRVLVLDHRATRVLSSLVGMSEVTEKNIMVIEDLYIGRQPFPDMDAIYLIEPTTDSLRKVAKDFNEPGGALYRRAHLLFLSPIPDEVMAMVKGGGGSMPLLVANLATFREVNLDFLVTESHTFHLDMGEGGKGKAAAKPKGSGRPMLERDAGPKVYSKLYGAPGLSTPVLNHMASSLVTLCGTLKEFPIVRYSATSPHATLLAANFQARMQDFISQEEDFRHNEKRATLLLLDRLDDPLSPLMHDFTYQCLVEDILPVTDGVMTLDTTNSSTPNAGVGGAPPAAGKVILNDNDALWVEFRHKHFGYVLDELGQRFRSLLSDHKSAAALAQGQGRSLSVKEMAQGTRDLPEFQERKNKVSQHIQMAKQCMAKVGTAGLMGVAALEQTMALGQDESGKSRSRKELVGGYSLGGEETQPGLREILMSSKTPRETKLRLLCLFVITQRGITAAERSDLVEASQLSPNDLKALNNLSAFSVNTGEPTGKGGAGNGSSPGGGGGGGAAGMLSRLGFGGGGGSKPVEEEHEFSHMRYDAPLKEVLSKLLADRLEIDAYPSILPLPARGAVSSSSASVRARGGGRDGADAAGARTIICVLGGLSFVEKRAVYELSLKTGRDIVVGGSSLMGPQAYLYNLQRMADDDIIHS